MVKSLLRLAIRKTGFFGALIYVKFLDFLFFDLNKSTTILSALLLLILLTILLSLALNTFKANTLGNLVVLKIKVSDMTILLKLYVKRR